MLHSVCVRCVDRFNRNIVECKDATGDSIIGGVWSFNRNIVECKVPYEPWTKGQIERFNRNIVECKGGTDQEICRRHSGFNRNIVECKDNSIAILNSPVIVLIETLWNVKLYRHWRNVV